MSTSRPNAASTSAPGLAPERSVFETQRAALLDEIAISFEHVLSNINKLNRNLEGVIAVGNEFSSVEALWSTFENVMGKDPNAEAEDGQRDEDDQGTDDASSEAVSER